MKKRVIIYSRVSKITGDFQRQNDELSKVAQQMNYEVVRIISEKISGGKKNEDRPGIQELLKLIQTEQIDMILIWELSRLGRDSLQTALVINELTERRINLYIHNYNLYTLNNDGDISPMAKFMVELLASISSMERHNITQRLHSGLKRYKENGGRVGRKVGYRINEAEMLTKYADVVKHLKKGISIRNVAILTNRSSKTVQKVKQLI